MKYLYLLLIIALSGCIPLQIAPKIRKGDKVKIAKRFKRSLPKQFGFIFKDPKKADEFYYFLNTKFQLNHQQVEDNVPVTIKGKKYDLSFYEVEKSTKTLNLIPVLFDAALDNNNTDPIFEDAYTSRIGYWYIVLLLKDKEFNDALHPDYNERVNAIQYLRSLHQEYLNTNNYVEIMFKEQDKLAIPSVD